MNDTIAFYDGGAWSAIENPSLTLDSDTVLDAENFSERTVKAIRKALGQHDQVLQKCDFCGHWGAVMCECPKCGAPIDPKE